MDKFTKEAICFCIDILTNDEYKPELDEYVEKLIESGVCSLEEYNVMLDYCNMIIEVCKTTYRNYLTDKNEES